MRWHLHRDVSHAVLCLVVDCSVVLRWVFHWDTVVIRHSGQREEQYGEYVWWDAEVRVDAMWRGWIHWAMGGLLCMAYCRRGCVVMAVRLEWQWHKADGL